MFLIYFHIFIRRLITKVAENLWRVWTKRGIRKHEEVEMLAARFDLIAISLILFIMIVGSGGRLFLQFMKENWDTTSFHRLTLYMTIIAIMDLLHWGNLFVGNFANISKHQV